jgi:hypothetical protein
VLSFCVQKKGGIIATSLNRGRLEPWFVTEVRISGDFNLASAIASALPTSEELENSSLRNAEVITHSIWEQCRPSVWYIFNSKQLQA